MLYDWLALTELQDTERRDAFVRKAKELFSDSQVALVGFSKGKSCYLTEPRHWNYNTRYYPHWPSWPIWDVQQVPLAQFLEANYAVFREDLERILDIGWYEELRKADGYGREHLATPGGSETVVIVRYGVWNDVLCEIVPRRCRSAG